MKLRLNLANTTPWMSKKKVFLSKDDSPIEKEDDDECMKIRISLELLKERKQKNNCFY